MYEAYGSTIDRINAEQLEAGKGLADGLARVYESLGLAIAKVNEGTLAGIGQFAAQAMALIQQVNFALGPMRTLGGTVVNNNNSRSLSMPVNNTFNTIQQMQQGLHEITMIGAQFLGR